MEAAQEGVSEGSPPSEGENEVSPTSQETKPNEESEVLPFDKHPRWQKINKERREFQQRAQQLEQELQSKKDLIEFGDWLKANPQKAKRMLEIAQEREEAKADPYADYTPEVAERFRKLDQLEQWRAEQELARADQESQTTQQVQSELDNEFDQRLMKDGYLDKDLNPKNEKVVDLISSTMKSYLDHTAKDPKRPTRVEFDNAYKTISEAMAYLREDSSKSALKDAVTTHVPASGSGKGAPPAGKSTRTEQDRLNDIMSSIGG